MVVSVQLCPLTIRPVHSSPSSSAQNVVRGFEGYSPIHGSTFPSAGLNKVQRSGDYKDNPAAWRPCKSHGTRCSSPLPCDGVVPIGLEPKTGCDLVRGRQRIVVRREDHGPILSSPSSVSPGQSCHNPLPASSEKDPRHEGSIVQRYWSADNPQDLC